MAYSGKERMRSNAIWLPNMNGVEVIQTFLVAPEENEKVFHGRKSGRSLKLERGKGCVLITQSQWMKMRAIGVARPVTNT